MNINDIEMYQATSIELVLNQKVDSFFQNPKVELLVFQASTNKNSNNWKLICSIEELIIVIRKNIAVGQIKRALKLMVVLECMMEKIQKE
ncbi:MULTISPECIES: hypothetical protein [unclassified Exiguobacterium]|uniref:hypothetical protein n=1 Tax=Exiguobacterium TaxID=33986 RepID=UPI000FE1A5F6|nr:MULTISPECIES: hypothetical protein [unclassified Exiguobacterium]RHB46593.1 hypothetical protein DW881_14240 [Exiguobacterium sp. AM39-5BH]